MTTTGQPPQGDPNDPDSWAAIDASYERRAAANARTAPPSRTQPATTPRTHAPLAPPSRTQPPTTTSRTHPVASVPPPVPHHYPPVAAAQTVNKAAQKSTIEFTNDLIAGANNVLPVVYGGPVKLGPLIVGVVGYRSGNTTYLYLTGLVSHGPIGSVSAVYLDDKPDMEGATFEQVLGTPGQAPLASLVQAYAQHGVTYADAMPSVAYVNIKLKSGMPLSNVPRVAVLFNGRTLYDMRTGATAFSTNPTLALGDYIKSSTYGAGKLYDVPSFSVCADFNDTPINGNPSRTIALAMTNKQTVADWITTLALYANVEVYQSGGIYYASPRRAKGSSFVFHDGNVLKGSVSIARLPMRQVPTIAVVKYTDVSVNPWSTRDSVPAKVPNLTDLNARDSTVTMPGITRPDQAAREALERLNWNILGNTSYVWTGFDEAAAVRKGDVVTFSNAVGVVDELVWITGAEDKGFGRYQFNGCSYDPAIFSGTPATGTTPIDSSIFVPGLTPPTIENVVGAEELYQKQNGDWDSRVRFEWDASGDDVSFDHFALAINDCTDPANEFLVDSRNTTLPSLTTYALQEGRQYRLYVQSVSVLGINSALAQSNIVTVLGKLAKPGDVPGFAGTEAGGTVYLRWQKAVDIDVTRYDVRRGAVGSAWSAKTRVIVLDALGVILPAQPEGVQEYAIKAIDSVGSESVNASNISITVTLDSGSVLLSQPFVTYVPSNMQSPAAGQWYTINPTGLWADGADVPNNAVGTFDDSLKDNLIGFPTAAAGSNMGTVSVDFGSAIAGRWTMSGTATIVDSLAGAPFNDALLVRTIEYSLDNAAFTSANSGDQFTARYVRVRVTCPTGYVMRTLEDFAITFNTTLREERGTVNVGIGGMATVTLANRYARWVTIQVTIQGTAAGVCTYDNVIVGTGVVNKFDVWKFTTAGGLAAGTVAWIFQGLN